MKSRVQANGPVPVLLLRLTNDILPRDGATRCVWTTAAAMDSRRFAPVPVFLVNGPRCRKACVNNGVSATVVGGGRFIDPGQLLDLGSIIRGGEIRIIHANDYKSNLYALLLRMMEPRIKIMTSVHGWVGNSRRGKWYCHLDRRMITRFDRVVAVSAALARQLSPTVHARTTVIPNGLDCSFWKPMPGLHKPESPVIGFAGRISAEKGWDLFIHTARLILASHPGVSFRVAGNGPDFNAMVSLARTLGIDHRIEFLGSVDDMRSFYATIDIVLAPSRSEGLPIAQLEAGAMEVPVVASSVGGVPELIHDGENGLLCKSEDIADFALKASLLIDNAEKRRAMGDAARRVVSTSFSIDLMIGKLHDVYESLTPQPLLRI